MTITSLTTSLLTTLINIGRLCVGCSRSAGRGFEDDEESAESVALSQAVWTSESRDQVLRDLSREMASVTKRLERLEALENTVDSLNHAVARIQAVMEMELDKML